MLPSIGGILILIWGKDSTNILVFPSLVLFAEFGMALAFNQLYSIHGHVFTTLFSATAMGICNFISRFATIFAPEVAEISITISISIFTFLSIISMILSIFIDAPLRPKNF